MAAKHKEWRDPFEIPREEVPAGVTYQWVVHKQLGAIDIDYQRMLDAGWRPVPFKRHSDLFTDEQRNKAGNVSVGGQVLMERAQVTTDIAREREIDAACLNGAAGRQVTVVVTVSIRLSHSELHAASAMTLTGSQYASRRIELIAQGSDRSEIHGGFGALTFEAPHEPPPTRQPKHPWLRWLFNLISTEK